MRRSASLSLGFTTSLARPLAHLPAWAGGHAGLAASILCKGTIRLLVFGEFWVGAKREKEILFGGKAPPMAGAILMFLRLAFGKTLS